MIEIITLNIEKIIVPGNPHLGCEYEGDMVGMVKESMMPPANFLRINNVMLIFSDKELLAFTSLVCHYPKEWLQSDTCITHEDLTAPIRLSLGWNNETIEITLDMKHNRPFFSLGSSEFDELCQKLKEWVSAYKERMAAKERGDDSFPYLSPK